MAFAIRPMHPADAPLLAAIYSASRRAAMPWLPDLHSPAEEAEYLATIAFPAARLWVAEADGAPAGFLAREGEWIMHLYLHPDRRRQGFGSALLAAARADDPPLLKLYAFQRNHAARAFYEKHGFRLAELTDGSGNMEREPDALYVWRNPSNREDDADGR
jgi:ribosomal protein S18 acetylase RimI-like enzyme